MPAALGTAGWAQAEADRARIRTVLRAPPDWRAPATTSEPASTTSHGDDGASIAPSDIVRTGGHALDPAQPRAGEQAETMCDVPAAGEALDAPVRARMESAFGADFSTVRIRRGKDAQRAMGQLGARAAAEGESIAFGAGEYAPGRPTGERLIAHELAHVLQARAAAGGGAPIGTAEAEAQAERFAGLAVAGARVVEAASPAVGRHLAPPADNTDAEVLAILERPIGSNDVAGQRKRVEDLIALFRTKPFWIAGALAVRFQTPAAGDAVAQAFHYRLSTETREVLIGILRTRARSSAGLIDPNDPRKDAKYVDEQFETVSCMLLWADRYRIQWPGGELTVFNDDIDWTKTSKALAHITLSPDLAAARRTSTEWADVAKTTGYDRVVAFYRGPGGVLLPNWFSPETTPKLFAAIMDVNGKIRKEAGGAEDAFRDLRNMLVVGAITGGVLRVFIRVMPGGGGLRGPRVGVDPDPVAPKPPRAGVDPVDPVAPDPAAPKPPAPKLPVDEPAPPASAPKLTMRERLTRFYERLQGLPRATNARQGFDQVTSTLDSVEDEYSGVPKKNPPPPPKGKGDGRMYPPLADYTKTFPDGSMRAETRGHYIDIGADGSIKITNKQSGIVEFEK